MITAIIFDYGGVLAHLNIPKLYRVIARHSNIQLSYTRTTAFYTLFHADIYKGTISPKEWHARLVKKIGLTLTLPQLERVCLGIVGKTIPSTLRIIHALNKHYSLYLLSNMEAFAHHALHSRIPHHFRKEFYSYRLHMIKTQPALFKNVLHTIKRKPHECIFIDDLASNLVTPRKLGIHTIHYTKGMNLAAALRRKGVHV